jgi:hypothetical protein
MHKYFYPMLGLLAFGHGAQADKLELKSGTVLNGKYQGGTASEVRFKSDTGDQSVETSQIVALTFSSAEGASPAAGAAPAAATSPAAGTSSAIPSPTGRTQAAPANVTLPAGTTLLVRMMDSVSSKSPPAAKFATKLENDVMAGDKVVVKAGTTIYGQVQGANQAGRAAGQSTLDIRLTEMAPGGKPMPITTSNYAQAGEASIKKAGRGAAGGAAIGAIAGDAGKGAAIGATAGALRRGQTVTIPPGALLEFQLVRPVTLTAGE